MSVIIILNELGLVDWNTIYVGFERGYLSKKDVVTYALEQVESTDSSNYYLCLLAGGEYDSDSDIKENLLNFMDSINNKEIKINESIELKKYHLGYMIALQKESISEEDKIEKLQRLYADFDYPEYMMTCSIYYLENDKESNGIEDPLVSLRKVIEKLKSELLS